MFLTCRSNTLQTANRPGLTARAIIFSKKSISSSSFAGPQKTHQAVFSEEMMDGCESLSQTRAGIVGDCDVSLPPRTEDMKMQEMICFLLKLISRLEFRSRNIFLLWSHHKCLFGCIQPVPWQYEVCTRTRVLEHSCEVTLWLTAWGFFRSNYDGVRFLNQRGTNVDTS